MCRSKGTAGARAHSAGGMASHRCNRYTRTLINLACLNHLGIGLLGMSNPVGLSSERRLAARAHSLLACCGPCLPAGPSLRPAATC